MILCPWCNQYIIIEELNCGIFRHAIMKNGKHVHPHATKEECDFLVMTNQIWGCGKPFRIINGCAEKCDYV